MDLLSRARGLNKDYLYGGLVHELADEIERLRKIEEMARCVLETFQKDEAQGYHTKDREFAISLLAKGFEMAGGDEQKERGGS